MWLGTNTLLPGAEAGLGWGRPELGMGAWPGQAAWSGEEAQEGTQRRGELRGVSSVLREAQAAAAASKGPRRRQGDHS